MLLFLRCCYLAFLPLCAVIILLHSSFLGKRIWTIMLCQRLSPDMPLQLASDTILRMLRARVHHHRQGQVNTILFLIFRWSPLRNHLVWLWPILTDFLSGYKLCEIHLTSSVCRPFACFRLFTIYRVRQTSMHGWQDWRRDQGMCS